MPHMRILCPIGMGGFEMCNELVKQLQWEMPRKYMGWMNAPYEAA